MQEAGSPTFRMPLTFKRDKRQKDPSSKRLMSDDELLESEPDKEDIW